MSQNRAGDGKNQADLATGDCKDTWLERPSSVREFLALGTRPRVIAHRGFSGKAPENTIPSFRAALELGVDMIELDVLSSRDGEVVVMHSSDVTRTTDGSGRVADLDLTELQKLDAGSWFSQAYAGARIPTLAGALDIIGDGALVNVEIKTEAVTDEPEGGIVDKVVTLVRQRRLADRVLISSFDARALSQARHLDDRIASASLFDNRTQNRKDPAAIMNDVGSAAFSLSDRQIDTEIVGRCHTAGRPVYVYTVDQPTRMRELIALGVNGLFTNRPDLMLELLRHERREPRQTQ